MPTPTPKTPESILDVVRQYSKVELGDKHPEPEPTANEPAFVPEPMKADGASTFKKVFGWSPKSIPKETPIRVFKAEDWPETVRAFIPATLPNGGLWLWPKHELEQLAFAIFHGDRSLIHGPTGSGKSALVEAWCHMTNTPLIRINCHRDMQSTDFLGKDIIKATPQGPHLEYDWSNTTIAVRYGGMLLIDEAFRSPCLMAIQSLLERGGTLTLPDAASLTPEQRKLTPPENKFWIVLTDNTKGTGDESGAYVAEVQDLSTLDRITATMHVPYIAPKDEAMLLRKAFPTLPEKVAKELTLWAAKMREAFQKGAVMQPISMRATLAISRKFVYTGNLAFAIQTSYASKLSEADALVAREAFHQVTGKKLELSLAPIYED